MHRKKCVHMIIEPARIPEISVDLGEVSLRWDENFPYDMLC